MHNEELHTRLIGKVHKILLDNVMSTGIRAAAVTEDGDSISPWILLLKMLSPDSFYVIANELGCVMACPDGKVTLVPNGIIDAVGNNLTIGKSGEVMVKTLRLANSHNLSVAFEVANQLLLLRINTDDRNAPFLAGLAYLGNLDELGIPVLDISHREIFEEGTVTEPYHLKYLVDKVSTDFIPLLAHLTRNLRHSQFYPYDILILRQPGREGFNDFLHLLNPLRMQRQQRFPSASRTTYTTLARTGSCPKFLNAILKSMCTCSHNFTNFAVAESLRMEVKCSRGLELSSFAFVQRGNIRQIFWREDFWRIYLTHFKGFDSTLKVKKNSPDFLYYFINNQHIKSICYYNFRAFEKGISHRLLVS